MMEKDVKKTLDCRKSERKFSFQKLDIGGSIGREKIKLFTDFAELCQ